MFAHTKETGPAWECLRQCRTQSAWPLPLTDLTAQNTGGGKLIPTEKLALQCWLGTRQNPIPPLSVEHSSGCWPFAFKGFESLKRSVPAKFGLVEHGQRLPGHWASVSRYISPDSLAKNKTEWKNGRWWLKSKGVLQASCGAATVARRGRPCRSSVCSRQVLNMLSVYQPFHTSSE